MDKHLRVVASHINKDDIYYKCPYHPEKCYKEFHLHVYKKHPGGDRCKGTYMKIILAQIGKAWPESLF